MPPPDSDPPPPQPADTRSAAARSRVPPALLDPMVAYFNPRRVILFGSHARGEAGPDSDIDLLVLLDDAPPELVTPAAASAARRPYHGPADVIPCREGVFEAKRRLKGSPLSEIAREGVVVYERRNPAA